VADSRPEPGWYPDRMGRARYRYWDGEAWTDLLANDKQEIRRLVGSEPAKVFASSAPDRSKASQPPKQDWFDQLLPWLVADEETGKTPLGQLLFFVSWIALTIFLMSGGC